MARVATPNLSLGTWVDGENPGAGSQTVDSTGLNGNFIKVDTALGVGHTAAGAHKASVIDGPNLAATAVDASSIQLSGSPLKLSVKALGIVSAMLAAGAVIAGKLADGAVEQASRIADGIITGAKLAAGTITSTQMGANSIVTAAITDGNVTAAKLEYKEYAALVSQAGANPPAVTVISNTLGGTPTWGRTATGIYTVVLTGAWTPNKTLIILSNTYIGFVCGGWVTVNGLLVTSMNSSGTAADGIINLMNVLIRVYP